MDRQRDCQIFIRFTIHCFPIKSGLIALWFSSYLLDDIEFATVLCARLSGLLKEPDEGWIRQGIEPVFHLSNPWPRPACQMAGRPGLAVLFIDALCAVFRKTVLKHTLRCTRAGLNREPCNVEPEQLLFILQHFVYSRMLHLYLFCHLPFDQ